ncbi:hypothetical protein [Nannocystis punicea]|uniref:Uncharacterized protein n=1 Tax=Nannocystis punicea TaxID=2995304 RepID=A0ABY7GSE4_9BACT|nr:hypothetical protein [Nannocystis poenicansa]WAS89855.1 hypothetical protein O0S08_26990 [Nannocystis poenicansa]
MTDSQVTAADLLADGGHFAEPYPDDLDWDDPEAMEPWEDQVHHRFLFHDGGALEYLHYATSNHHAELEVWGGTYRLDGDRLHLVRTHLWSWSSGDWMDEKSYARMDFHPRAMSVTLARDGVGLYFDFDGCIFRPLRACPHIEPMLDDVRFRIDECKARVRSHFATRTDESA